MPKNLISSGDDGGAAALTALLDRVEIEALMATNAAGLDAGSTPTKPVRSTLMTQSSTSALVEAGQWSGAAR